MSDDNPIVIFFDTDRVPDRACWADLREVWSRTPGGPAGWTCDGHFHLKIESRESYAVLIFNDISDIKDEPVAYANKHRNKPLPIVIHSGSELYLRRNFSDWTSKFSHYGRPIIVADFSHFEGKPAFDEICALKAQPNMASGFQRRFLISNQLTALDNLAAVYQARILIASMTPEETADISPSIESLEESVESLEESVRRMLPSGIAKDIEEYEIIPDKIGRIRALASDLIGSPAH